MSNEALRLEVKTLRARVRELTDQKRALMHENKSLHALLMRRGGSKP